MSDKESTIIFGKNPVRSALGANHVKTFIVSRRLSDDPLVMLARSSHDENQKGNGAENMNQIINGKA